MTTPIVYDGGLDAGRYGKPYRNIREAQDSYELINFDIRNVGRAVVVLEASVGHLHMGNGVVDNAYRVLDMPRPLTDGVTIGSFHIHDIVATNLVRGGLRFKQVTNGLVENVQVYSDGVGADDIPAGFSITDSNAHDVAYKNCKAVGFHKIVKPGEYKNGDGFSDEEGQHNISYEDCVAIDNADGGFDCKSKNLSMVRCTAEQNNHNFRLWGYGRLEDCVSVDPKHIHVMFSGHGGVSTFDIIRQVFRGGTGPHFQVHDGTAEDVINIVDPVVDGDTLRIVLREAGRQADVNVLFTEDSTPVNVVVNRIGNLQAVAPGGVDGRVIVTVRRRVTVTETRTYDAETGEEL